MKVQVYWNRHKKMWSVRNPRGRVIEHTTFLALHEPVFYVSQAGWRRFQRTKRRTVIAWVEGELVPAATATYHNLTGNRVYFSPHDVPYFYRNCLREDNRVDTAAIAWFDPLGQVWI